MDEPNQADEWEISKENIAPLKQVDPFPLSTRLFTWERHNETNSSNR